MLTPGALHLSTFWRPTHVTDASRGLKGLRYAVALNDEAPQIISLETAEYSREWPHNIWRSAAIGRTTHRVTRPGRQTLRIWMVDPGVVLDKLEAATGGTRLLPSFTGPRETAYPPAPAPSRGLGLAPGPAGGPGQERRIGGWVTPGYLL